MDARKSRILRAIVEEYVATGQPVGSKTVAAVEDISVSAATVRNDMSALEGEGYIAQPHTSAGRIPTDLGYRTYVDELADPAVLTPTHRREVASFFSSASQVMEELLAETSRLLARLTSHAAVVVGPDAEVERVRGTQLVALSSDRLLLVVVLSDGAVARELLQLAQVATEDEVVAAARVLHHAWNGAAIGDLGVVEVPASASIAVRETIEAAVVAMASRSGRHDDALYVGGASRLAAEQDAFSPELGVAPVLELLEQHAVLTSLMRELLGPGLTISIGAENERLDLHECSLVLAPYLIEGEPAGTVGVLGPTRMDYRRASAAVDEVSRRLGRQLSQ